MFLDNSLYLIVHIIHDQKTKPLITLAAYKSKTVKRKAKKKQTNNNNILTILTLTNK